MASWLKRVASDGPADDSEQPPVQSALQRLLAKRKAEASPAVSPEKGDRPADASLASELADRLALDEAKGEAAAARPHRAPSAGSVPDEHQMAGKKNHLGTDQSRWEDKVDEDAVFDEIKKGCNPKCGCVHKHAMGVMSEIIAERVLNQKRSGAKRREWAREYYDGHRSAEAPSGFQGKWYVEEKNACTRGMSVRTGLTESFLYARMRDVREGVMADAMNLGGSRVKGGTVSGDLQTDSPAYMACMGWFTGLCRELEPMPNSDLHEIDHIEFKDLFAECKMDLAAGGCAPENFPSLTLWRKVWNAEFPNLRRRAFKSVDSKDKVRAELRRLLRKKTYCNGVDRAYLIGLRASYHGCIRRERCRYWEDRLLPAKEPLKYFCYIQDGATQSWYQLPRLLDTDHGRTGCKFKLVGNLWHGHTLVLCIIHPQVPDDANLVQHCMAVSQEELIKVRIAKDEPDFLAPNGRIQLDGVGTNWGKTTFAHLTDLVDDGLTDELLCARNPVGNTHEDIDAIFALIRQKLANNNVMTPSELESVIMSAFPDGKVGGKIPVVIRHVDCTYDYQTYYAADGVLDKSLANFSYSQHTSGYHVFSASKAADGNTSTRFKKYQQDAFVTIAFTPQDILHVKPEDRPAAGVRLPCELIVKNGWEDATVLLGKPAHASLTIAPLPDFDWDSLLDDCLHVIPDNAENAALRTEWQDWVGARPRTVADVEARFMASLPRKPWEWPKRPAVRPAAATGAAAVSEHAMVMQQPRTVASSAYGGGEGDAAREESAKSRAASAVAENVGRRDPLSAGDLCFTKMNYTNSDGFQIPWLIVQLEDDFHGADTRNPDLKLHCKWFHSKNGKYGGVWEEWKNPADGLQWNSRVHGDDHQVERGSIEMTGVKFTQRARNAAGGWKLSTATKRMVEASPTSQWNAYKGAQ